MCFYLDHLSECSKSSSEVPEGSAVGESETGHSATYQLILGGYSFGSLIVAKLLSVTDIFGLFESSKRSASAVAILDRALTLSTRWRERLLIELEDGKPARSQHKKKLSLDHSMPHTVGGDERSPSRKREHLIRDIPQLMKHTIRRHSNPSRMKAAADSESAQANARKHTTFEIHVRYLLVSPVLVPLSTFLPPLGLPSLFALLGLHDRTTDDKSADFMSLTTSTLVLFGTEDNFTSAKKLQQWAEKLEQRADGRLQWFALDGAGHFWREPGAIAALKTKISLWASQPT
jgi:pimeloyl-ACP methyl ester carboxylesterase